MESPLEVERVEWYPSTAEALEVRVAGRWRDGSAPADGVELLVDGRRFRAVSAGGGDDGVWRARFAVPVDLRASLGAGRLRLAVGARELALPAASVGPSDEGAAPAPAVVVEPGVLASLRSRREGLADEGLVRRAQAAEATVETLETQLGLLESGLREAHAARERLEARLRAAEQREESERRVRAEAEQERDEATAAAERRVDALRTRLRAAERHAEALAAEIDGVRREGAEAQHAAAAARAAAERAERAALARGQGAAAREEAAAVARQLDAERAARADVERSVAAARRVAAELQERLDEERRLRLAAEAARPAGVDRLVADIDGLAAARGAFAAQAEAIEDIVQELRTRVAAGASGEDVAAPAALVADLERVTQEREALAARLVAAERALERGAEAGVDDRDRLARRVTELEADRDGLAGRVTELEGERELLLAELERRDAALSALQELVGDTTERETAIESLVADVVAMASSLNERFAASLDALSARVASEVVDLRAALETERAARLAAEARLEAEPPAAPVVPPELESTRRELAAAQEQLAAERARSEKTAALRAQALRLVEDLGAAELRLKEREEEEEAEPDRAGDAVPEGLARSAGPEAPPPDATAINPRVVGARRRRPAPWLSAAVAALAHTDEPAAARLLLDLLPAQAGAPRRPLVYGLALDGRGSFRVDVDEHRALVTPDDDLDALAVRFAGPVAALAPLAGGAAPRRLPGARIEGRKRLARRLLKARREPLDLADLAAREIDVPPAHLLAVLAAAVDPAWTAGHAFAVRYVIEHADGAPDLAVAVADGAPIALHTAPTPQDAPAATVFTTGRALLPLLARTALPRGERALLTGDEQAVTTLHAWFARAQGLPLD